MVLPVHRMEVGEPFVPEGCLPVGLNAPRADVVDQFGGGRDGEPSGDARRFEISPPAVLLHDGPRSDIATNRVDRSSRL